VLSPISNATRVAAAALAVAAVLAACSSAASSAPTSAPATSAPATAASSAALPSSAGGGGDAVTIKDFAFTPVSLAVAVGTTVTWTSQDSAGHTVTADDGSFGSDTLATGALFSQTFAKAGTFTYHCKIHPSMTATIVVQ
jgi:plastocyanin